MGNDTLKQKVAEEGYCCLRGYLDLCRSRGETPDSMGEFIEVAGSTIRYHYAQCRLTFVPKSHRCKGAEDCMQYLCKG